MRLLTFMAGPGPRLGVVVGEEAWDANMAVVAQQRARGHPSPYAAAEAPVPPSLRGSLEGGVGGPHALALKTRVNNEARLSSNTSQFGSGVPHLVSFLSQFFTLAAGCRAPFVVTR